MKHSKSKSTTKVVIKRNKYSGEVSPYRDWLDEKGDYNQEHEAEEPIEANPDRLTENDSLYTHEVFLDPEQVQAVERAWPYLTKKQQQVLEMVGLEGKTLENAGAILGITKQGVFKILNKTRLIIITKGFTKSEFHGYK